MVVKYGVLYSKSSRKALIPFKPWNNLIKYPRISCMGFLPPPLLWFWGFHIGTHSACGLVPLNNSKTFDVSLCYLGFLSCRFPFFYNYLSISFLFFSFPYPPFLLFWSVCVTHWHLWTLLIPAVFSRLDILHLERWSFCSLR